MRHLYHIEETQLLMLLTDVWQKFTGSPLPLTLTPLHRLLQNSKFQDDTSSVAQS